MFRKTASEGGTGERRTHTQNQKSLYGAGSKGLFAQWPFALQWGVAGVLRPDQGHKHQTSEAGMELWKAIHVTVHTCVQYLYGEMLKVTSDAKG